MNEEIKKAIIQLIDELPPMHKYTVAVVIITSIYEKLPEWKEEQAQCHRQALENLLDFIESMEDGDEE